MRSSKQISKPAARLGGQSEWLLDNSRMPPATLRAEFSFFCHLLWSPYGIRQTIIFLPCGFFFLSSFFPRLISAVADWMSAILPHMVWPLCEFSAAGLKRGAHGSVQTQDARKSPKIAICAPSHKIVGLYLRN